jgi:hypothetical protein
LTRSRAAPRGLAGGASGGDILFQELCAELGIPSDLYLALSPDAFCEASVEDSGPRWEKRFYDLVAKLPTRVLAESAELPAWLRSRPDYDLWKRNNLWMLHNAIALAGRNITLIALWNGQGGDGPGGSERWSRRSRSSMRAPLSSTQRRSLGLNDLPPAPVRDCE